MGLAGELDAALPQVAVGVLDVVDTKIEDGTRHLPLGDGVEHDANFAEVDERQAGRVELRHQGEPKRLGVEGDGAVEVIDALCNLEEGGRWRVDSHENLGTGK